MKKKLTALFIGIGTVCLALALIKSRAGVSYYKQIANEVSLAINKTYVFDLNQLGSGIDRLSVQETASTSTISAASWTDGSQSTMSITVVSTTTLTDARASITIVMASNTALTGSYASDAIIISSNTILTGATAYNYICVSSFTAISTNDYIAVNGSTMIAGRDWAIGATSAATAINLAVALNRLTAVAASTITLSTVQINADALGTAQNSFTLTSSTPSALILASTNGFFGGADPVTIALSSSNLFRCGIEWFPDLGASSGTATSIALALNAGDFGVTASTVNGASTVTVTVNQLGSYYNQYTLTSSSATALIVRSSSFTGGTDPAILTIKSVSLINGIDYLTGNTATDTAKNLSAAIATNTALVGFVSSTWSIIGTTTGWVRVTAISTGTAYQYAVASSSQAAQLLNGTVVTTSSGNSTSALFGGRDRTYITIQGIKLQQGQDWTSLTSVSDTAKSLSNSIMANATLASLMGSTWTSGGLVTATSTIIGLGQNFAVYTTTQVGLTLNVPVSTVTAVGAALGFFQGGTNSGYSTSTQRINLPGHGFSTGLQVWLTTASANTITPLIGGTTYFTIYLDSNTIALALTSTGAVAGSSITLTSQTNQVSSHSYTLTPVAYSGTVGMIWEVSNDSVTWATYTPISSVTLTSGFVSTSTVWDMGSVNSRFLRMRVIAPTAGGINLTTTVNGKN